MISIEECRKTLGEIATNLTDKQVEDLRNALYQLTESVLDKYFEEN